MSEPAYRFHTKIVGVTFENEDGTSRQYLISRCRKGDAVTIEPSPSKKYPHAIGVYDDFWNQLGYLNADLANEFYQKDWINSKITAVISSITGDEHNNLGCNLLITIEEPEANVDTHCYDDFDDFDIVLTSNDVGLGEGLDNHYSNGFHADSINTGDSIVRAPYSRDHTILDDTDIRNRQNRVKPPVIRRTWLFIVASIFLPPLGIALIWWKHKDWSRFKRILLTIVLSFWSVILFSMFGDAPSDPSIGRVSDLSVASQSTITDDEQNPLLNLEVLYADVYNGTRTEVIGKRGYVQISKSDLLLVSNAQFVDFVNVRVVESGLNWFSIVCDDGTGLIFAGSISEYADYGLLDEDGCIIGAGYGTAVYRHNLNEYEYVPNTDE